MPKNTKTVPAENAKVASEKKTVAAPAKVEKVEPVKTAPVKAAAKTETKAASKTPAKKTAPKATAKEGGAVEERKVRYFKCVYEGETFGRFSGYKPAACKKAASKALTSILREKAAAKKDVTVEIPFSMVECTRGRAHKISQYIGKRVELEKPITVNIKSKNADGTTTTKVIEYKFKNKITKVKGQTQKVKPAKKATTKKAATKKTATKKPATKKATTKKTDTKKVAEKKPVAKKAETKVEPAAPVKTETKAPAKKTSEKKEEVVATPAKAAKTTVAKKK